MSTLAASIDVLRLRGARRMLSASGRDVVVIDLATSRARPHKNGAVYLALDVVENRDGEDRFGNSHFIVEPTTKEEREGGLKLPFLGNAKVRGSVSGARAQAQQPAPRPLDESDDEIPF